jgi:glycosyltransferase involved in cell wall biosynthesis
MFSVIIPAFNESKYIKNTLNSIPKELETIVVCNGCTDDTEEIAKKYASKVITDTEANVSKARNLGVNVASFDNLIFLDADTLMTNTNLTKLKHALTKGVVGTCKVKPDINSIRAKAYMSFKNLFLYSRWNTGLHFCKKGVFEKINGYNENLKKKELKDFFSRCTNHGKFVVANTYVIGSMRRFEKYGYLRTVFYWIFQYIKPNKEDYPLIR